MNYISGCQKKGISCLVLACLLFVSTEATATEGLYFSSSGMIVSMEDSPLGSRHTGFPAPNKYKRQGFKYHLEYTIPSMGRMLKGKNRVLKKSDTGFGATIAVGKKFWKGFRGELEVGYRQGGFEDLMILTPSEQLKDDWVMGETKNGIEKGTLMGTDWGYLVNGSSIDVVDGGYRTRSLLANLIYDIPTGEKLYPYIGAGVGMHWTTLDNGIALSGGNGLAYQLLAGLNYKATDRLELFSGYRYFSADAVQMWDQIMVGLDTHSMEFGVRYYLESSKKKKANVSSSSPVDHPFYVGISGGLVQQQAMGTSEDNITWGNGISVGSHEYKAGYGLEAVVGYRVCSWCRVELEYSYKFSEVASLTETTPPWGTKTLYSPEEFETPDSSSRSVIHALLINIYADLDIAEIKEKTGILPFVGVGVGGMYIDSQVPANNKPSWSSMSMRKAFYALQMAAGFGYSLTERITMGVQYKYLITLGDDEAFGEINYSVAKDVAGTAFGDRVNNIGIHSYGLFARYDF